MKIFLSWSGERSRLLAESLRVWLQDVISFFEPWVSSQDIEKGARWASDLAKQLEDTDIGIICLTAENTGEPWILFEAGALAKALDRSRVCTYLVDLHPTTLSGPLVQFQATQATKTDTLKLLQSINNQLGDKKLSADRIERVFERAWPELERSIIDVRRLAPTRRDERTERDLLEELVDLARQQTKKEQYEIEPHQLDLLPLNTLFVGADIEILHDKLNSIRTIGSPNDQNAEEWAVLINESNAHSSIDGTWSSRWNERVTGSKWNAGTAKIISYGKYSFLLHYDPDFQYFMLLKRRDERILIGRHFNLNNVRDASPWVGVVVDDCRIDGMWNSGRWDLRRSPPLPMPATSAPEVRTDA